MGLLTTTEKKDLEEARKGIVPADRVCPACKEAFVSTGATLSAWNGALGIEGHKCPRCGAVLTIMR
ncbi:MAG: hypothetical protein ACXVCV_18585 [Polyangia bacterium]